MKRNIAKIDRLIRVTIAAFLILIVLSNYVIGPLAVVSVIISLVLFGTALFGYCPLYSMFKISSLRKK